MQLTKENTSRFLARYGTECDGVIVSVETVLRPGPRRTIVVVETKDAEVDWEWCRVRFTITGVEQLRFEMLRSTFEVLSGGIQIVWQGDVLYLVFDAYPDNGPGLPDLSKNLAFVAGRACTVAVEPIPVVE